MKQCETQKDLSIEYPISEEEQQVVIKKLWYLLKWQTRKYNGIDSTSIKIEKAQSLFESLLYTISLVAETDGIPTHLIFRQNLEHIIQRGQIILSEKSSCTKVKWELMRQSVAPIQNVFYIETVKNLGHFFEHYEIYYEAHLIPCSIDYPLLCLVSEKMRGISYIEEYINKMQIENDFLKHFDSKNLIRLYESSMQDYEELLFNLCEQVLINAIGLAIVGANIMELNITKEQRKILLSIFVEKTTNQIALFIEDAAIHVCNSLNIKAKNTRTYFLNAVTGLSVRLRIAAEKGDLSGVFVSMFSK